MRKVLHVSLTLLVLFALCGATTPQVFGGGRAFGTITGTVRDNKGNPLAGALVSLVKDGASEVVKQVRSATDGTFSARVAPGHYSVRAVADGFSEALFPTAYVRSSDEIVYRFNLEPVGSGRTAPERRRDRDDPKWRIRAAQSRRSIFQIREGEDKAIKEATRGDDSAVEASEIATEEQAQDAERRAHTRTHGVVETYAAASSNPLAPAYAGTNFAMAKRISDHAELIFAGQTGAGAGAPQRLEATTRLHAGDNHRVSLSFGGGRLAMVAPVKKSDNGGLGQFSMRAIDEWIVRDGIVVVVGLDYSRFVGAGNARLISPRMGLQFDANARTRIKAAYAPGAERNGIQSEAAFEEGSVLFRQPLAEAVALVDGRAVMERSRRFEFGVERVLNNESSVEATAFFDTTTGRGVGLLSMPLSAFSGESGAALTNVANQEGSARGMRVVYSRRINQVLSASAGYSFGRGQRLSSNGLTNPAELFRNGFFQTAAVQLAADLSKSTHVRTVFRFSPNATVFAIDPFAGRLAVYDPSLSILITQELPTFGLPVRAEAIIDARNLFDTQTSADNGDILTLVNATRRSIRGGISVRF